MTMATNVEMDEKDKKDLEGEESKIDLEERGKLRKVCYRHVSILARRALVSCTSILNAAHHNYMCSPLFCLRGYY